MKITLGMHVATSDGHDMGTVDRVILDPASGAVKAAVLRKGMLLHQDVEVPDKMLTAGPGGDARLTMPASEVDQLPRFDEASYTAPPPEYVPPMGYPLFGVYWPVGGGVYGAPLGTWPGAAADGVPWTGDSAIDREVRDALRRQDIQNAVIGEGSTVVGRDGEKVGTVHDLTFDPIKDELTQLVVHHGLLMGKDTTVPASLIDSVDDGVVYLRVDAKEVVG